MPFVSTRLKRFRGTITPPAMLAMGASKLSHTAQELLFLKRDDTEACIRREGGADQYLYSRTGARNAFDGVCTRVEDVDYAVVDREQAHRLVAEFGQRFRLQRIRTIYRLGTTQVNVDEVQHLGRFVEIRAETDADIEEAQQRLGLSPNDIVDGSYYELMLANGRSPFMHSVIQRYDDTQGMTFGIVSGVLTTVGVVMGVIGSETSAFLVIKVLVALAFADSASDALGQFRAEWTKWDSDLRSAITIGLNTLIGKVVMPLTFVLWFAVLPFNAAVWLSLIWAGLVLAAHAAAEAVARERPLLRHPLLILALSAAAVTITKTMTLLLECFFAVLS